MKEFLKEVSIFSELNDEELDLLVKIAHEKNYPKNSFIVRKDEAGTSLFLIRSGKVKVVLEKTIGGEIPLSTLGRGSFFGEMSLFDGRPRSATVTAQEDTTIVEIRREDFFQQITKSPEISLKILAEMAGRIRSTDETVKEFADKVYREAYTSLEDTLNAKLRSAETIYQKTEDRAFKTIDHVESSRKTLMLVAYIIIGVFSTIGGFFGFFGYTKYENLEEINNQAIEIGKKIESTKKLISDTEEDIRKGKSVREIMLNIRKVREDMRLDEEIDRKKDEVDVATLKTAAMNFRRSKQKLLKYIENQDDYGPEEKLEAVQTFLKLISRSGEDIKYEDKYSIFTILKTILTNRKEGDWRMRKIAREELINLWRKDSELAKKYIREELHEIISDKKMEDNVKLDVARVLAAIGKADNDTKEVLMKVMMKKGDRELDSRAKRRVKRNARAAAVALIQMGDNEGRKYIIETIKKGGKPGFWAALSLGHLLSNKTPDDLGWKEDIDLALIVIDRINEELDSSDFNKYIRTYAEKTKEDLKNKSSRKQ